MNIDNFSIVSKYFTKYSMDGSLTDFRDEKKSCKGPKTIQKLKKNKTKRTKKNIKGQRDIRIALKQKNDLISYTKEFDNVCKQVGVDVDSGQLQLAIALSKSLENETDISDTSDLVSTQQRIGKIRKTLQEYGFKVPELKIINKKHKKHRTEYKLILTSEAEKSQLISENYSKILFGNLDSYKLGDDGQCQKNLKVNLFYLTTSALYESMKDNTIFYVDDLVEKSDSIGSLLRDWSDIPGRPISPKFLKMDAMNVNDIDCSQDDLDIILSGSVKDVQQIINNKQIARNKQDRCTPLSNIIHHEMSPKCTCNTVTDDVPISGIGDTKLGLQHIKVSFKKLQETDISNIKMDTVQYRSSSPDIFDDDDVSSIMDTTKNTNAISQEYKTKLFKEDNLIDITECVNITSQNSNKILLSQNVTNRNSNDYVESKCVMTSSQFKMENHINIDFTLSSNEKETVGKLITNNFDSLSAKLTKSFHNIDLTKSPEQITVLINTDDNIAFAETSDQSAKHEIDLTQSSDEDESVNLKAVKELSERSILYGVDLTHSSDTSDDLPFVQLSTTQKALDDDTIILDKNEYLDNDKVRCSMILKNRIKEINLAQNVKIDDIEDKDCVIEDNSNLGGLRCYEAFVVDYLEENAKKKEAYKDLNNLNIKDKINDSDIDLTQDLDSSEDSSIDSSPLKFAEFPNSSSLRKEDNISINYDEISDENLNTKSSNKFKFLSSKQTIDSNNDLMSNSSQNSEFDISDKELNYSLHKTRNMVNDFDFGGISIIDNIKNTSLNIHNKITYKNTSDDVLTEDVGNETKNGHSKTNYSTNKNNPCSNCEASVATPNELYIVKTSEVTPILDYESMTTPQRNRELDKYGLKPFKRKRAIQLLTHLYNQTHPIVEPCKDEQSSPSKKRKKETPEWSTPKKITKSHKNLYVTPEKSFTLAHNNQNVSPRSVTKSKSLSIEGSNENACVYEVTNEVPDIRNIECSPDEWVFQKREKTKVDLCRVPLHVAFHNYVSSRRDLREAILRYEPVNIDVIHKDLVGYGHRYDPKDLLKFLDKRCITVKTTDNNSRNKRQ